MLIKRKGRHKIIVESADCPIVIREKDKLTVIIPRDNLTMWRHFYPEEEQKTEFVFPTD